MKTCLLYRITETYVKLFTTSVAILFASNPYTYNTLINKADRLDYELTRLSRKLY